MNIFLPSILRAQRFCAALILISVQLFTPVMADKASLDKNDHIIDSFSSKNDSNLPPDWHPSRKDISMFSILKENGDQFLRVKTKNGCTSIGKQFSFSSSNYPYLSWKWRVHKLPTGGNETKSKKNDSGAAVYVFFKGKFKLNNIIKYVWSSTLSQGTVTNSPYNKRARIVVLRSGIEQSGEWINETVNINEDYRRLFGQNPPPIEGIGLLSDSDNTESEAMADYDDFRITKGKDLAVKEKGK